MSISSPIPAENSLPTSRVRRALVSVSDKTGITSFARQLAEWDVEILSTGGTARHLESEGIPVRDVASYTGFPEMMDGRLKTLHPKIFGGILGRRGHAEDESHMRDHAIVPIDLVVVNLYPFAQTVAQAGVTREEAIEQIDIGGPSLVRAAAKNHAFVAVVSDPRDYSALLDELRADGGISLETRRRLAAKAFRHTADYDARIAEYLSNDTSSDYPRVLYRAWELVSPLRYGENPHQKGALYRDREMHAGTLLAARPLHGKELSYNNYLDLDAACRVVRDFSQPAAVVIKHNTPCGAAIGSTLAAATANALAGDPLSAFGGIVAVNQLLDAETAEVLIHPDNFLEVILAPEFTPEAFACLTTRPKWKANVRLLAIGKIAPSSNPWTIREIDGGILAQQPDASGDDSTWKTVTTRTVEPSCWDDLRFAWKLVRHVRSNAIVVARHGQLCGVGGGQTSRVDSVDIALGKAGERAAGGVLASDAFFPFPDSIERLAQARVAAVIQPGGSRNDSAVIEAAERLGIPMVFTGQRHFLH